MKKILFFITSLAGGGAEKVLVNMVNHMDLNKYDITVQTLFDVGVNKKNLSSQINYKYIFKHCFRGNVQLFKLFSPAFLYKRLVGNDYDVVVSYFQGATTRIVSGCLDEKTRIVQWIHNEFHSQDDIARCYRSLNESINAQKRFDATVYVSESVKNIYETTFPHTIKNGQVLYNIVESDVIQSKALDEVADIHFSSEAVNIISVGRLVKQKAFDRLIRIVGKLVKNDKIAVRLFLLGDGELRDSLMELSKKEEVTEYITFLGYKENPYKYVKACDLFVCSSLHEGFSTAVTEALIVGTPVITTECSGMRELLGDNQEYGVITKNSEDALYQGLKTLLNDGKMLKEMRVKAEERGRMFGLERSVAEVESFFDKL